MEYEEKKDRIIEEYRVNKQRLRDGIIALENEEKRQFGIMIESLRNLEYRESNKFYAMAMD